MKSGWKLWEVGRGIGVQVGDGFDEFCVEMERFRVVFFSSGKLVFSLEVLGLVGVIGPGVEGSCILCMM